MARNAGGFNVPVEVTLATEALGNQHLTTLSIRDVSLWREIERLRTELLSTVGYELRTPLTSLSGAVDLADALGRDLPQEIRELLDIAQRNSRRLTQVVNDILDAERIQAGRLQLDLQRLDGHDAVKEVVASLAEAAAARQIRLETALPAQSLPLRADPQRLQQVLRILLDNALKFAPEGSAVTVAAERKAREIRISVLDQGTGVPAEFRERIFQRFARAEPGGRSGAAARHRPRPGDRQGHRRAARRRHRLRLQAGQHDLLVRAAAAPGLTLSLTPRKPRSGCPGPIQRDAQSDRTPRERAYGPRISASRFPGSH